MMGDYYNTSRAPKSVMLRRGGAISVPGKHWAHIEPEDEGTADLMRLVKSKEFVRKSEPMTLSRPKNLAEQMPVPSNPLDTSTPLKTVTEEMPITGKVMTEGTRS